jgi:hypothetical protein
MATPIAASLARSDAPCHQRKAILMSLRRRTSIQSMPRAMMRDSSARRPAPITIRGSPGPGIKQSTMPPAKRTSAAAGLRKRTNQDCDGRISRLRSKRSSNRCPGRASRKAFHCFFHPLNTTQGRRCPGIRQRTACSALAARCLQVSLSLAAEREHGSLSSRHILPDHRRTTLCSVGTDARTGSGIGVRV